MDWRSGNAQTAETGQSRSLGRRKVAEKQSAQERLAEAQLRQIEAEQRAIANHREWEKQWIEDAKAAYRDGSGPGKKW